MANSDFFRKKLELLKKDNQGVLGELASPIEKYIQGSDSTTSIEIPIDGTWFKVSFSSVQVKEDRLVINAERIRNGFFGDQYIVEFRGTRAAYLRGYYEPVHRAGRWPFISWDIRSYTNHPQDPTKRVYVNGFYAHQELKKMIQRMEQRYGVKNIVNTYINDNLLRLQIGIRAGKSPSKIENEWSKGMMESLGYHHVEALDTGTQKGAWQGAKVHWFKKKEDALL